MKDKYLEISHTLYENRIGIFVGAAVLAATAGIAVGVNALVEAWGNGIAPDGPVVDLNTVNG